MEEILNNVNWLAVVLGAVVAFVVGWLWYSPKLFGEKWAEGVGVDLGHASEMPVSAMVSQMVGLLLLSWFVGVTASNGALATVLLGTAAFTLMAYAGGLFTKKSAYARLVDGGYWILSVVIMIVCQVIL